MDQDTKKGKEDWGILKNPEMGVHCERRTMEHMVEDPIPSFLPSYSPSFSFNNFIAYTFPDIAMDLDSFA